jgi:hypothetical protein
MPTHPFLFPGDLFPKNIFPAFFSQFLVSSLVRHFLECMRERKVFLPAVSSLSLQINKKVSE